MPAQSRKQQRFLYATKGSDWVHEHHFDLIANKKKKDAHRKKRSRAK